MASVDFYNEWVKDVKTSVAKEKLLVFSVKQGWEPLCHFLDLPVPNIPFPKTNDSYMMKKMLQRRKVMGYVVLIGIPLMVGTTFYFIKDYIISNS